MKGLKKRRRVQVIVVAGLALVLSTALVGYAMRDGINFFYTPTQIAEAPPEPHVRVRIGGLVEAGSLIRGQGDTVRFRVTDTNAAVDVAYVGILPDLFAEGQGTVVTGKLEGGVFRASEVLARHDETYMPREVIDALKEQGVYVAPGQS